jgi:hypothetical protein
MVKPFSDNPSTPVTFEVAEFVPAEGECSSPFTEYTNTLYVYPRSLKYDQQKIFAKVQSMADWFYSVLLPDAVFM